MALKELVEPTITVREKGVVAWLLPTASFSPVGLVLKFSTTVCGSSRTLLVSVSPPESVAVRRNSRKAGYSWSGAANVPWATPEKSCTGCSWQLLARSQWWSISDQESLEADSVPSCWSVAEPEKEILSPTFQAEVEGGVSIVAVGGVLPALIVSGESKVSVAPLLSVTLRSTR